LDLLTAGRVARVVKMEVVVVVVMGIAVVVVAVVAVAVVVVEVVDAAVVEIAPTTVSVVRTSLCPGDWAAPPSPSGARKTSVGRME